VPPRLLQTGVQPQMGWKVTRLSAPREVVIDPSPLKPYEYYTL